MLKLIGAVAMTVTVFPVVALADSVTNARELFAQWAPTSVSLTPKGVLRVVLPQPRITDTIYYAAISAGFCFGPLLGKPLHDVGSVFILNENQTQGWLFETGTNACEQINSARGNQATVLIAGHSSVHTDTANGL
ncbi:hypothetical protein [Roseovarius sp.]|uniref:hypothetical protein n=1 Tax=Roseovarius sp. TaxID=1486281 RepID=UPI00257D53E3|nr:hypothetical protein [Roseovarius sp.]|tara:strand:- start:316 stop:720 length:405 start_codon:yes stop_codon:yes gene_type:complete